MLMVQAIMTADPITIGPDEPLLQAVSAMERGRFRRLPVVKDGRVVGIITDRDIRKALSSP
ncbi:MAG TPA: CBS domain-containing protein, partial [Deltaproteobacteria bacterium]|nr:CBS domain-containing protein [Deltaproteobacteria bacterium]